MGKAKEFTIVFSVLILVIIINTYIYFDETKMSISGAAVTEMRGKFTKFDFSTVTFIMQWVLVLVAVVYFYVKSLIVKGKEKNEEKNLDINVRNIGEKGTDLDRLYELLKKNKTIKISTIAKLFKIKKEKAVGWCEILENQDFAVIERPAFSEPRIRIK